MAAAVADRFEAENRTAWRREIGGFVGKSSAGHWIFIAGVWCETALKSERIGGFSGSSSVREIIVFVLENDSSWETMGAGPVGLLGCCWASWLLAVAGHFLGPWLAAWPAGRSFFFCLFYFRFSFLEVSTQLQNE